MRTTLLTVFTLLGLTAASHATTLNISVRDFSFSPNTATIQLGDTVVFTWVNGSHTTTSRLIPSGAASWDRPMTSSNTTFTYVPTVAGTYNYVCTPHESMGHIGSFTVNGPTSISGYEATRDIFDLYPNPAQGSFTLSLKQSLKGAAVTLYDLGGRQVLARKDKLTTENSVDISMLNDGLYIIRVELDGKSYTRKLMIRK